MYALASYSYRIIRFLFAVKKCFHTSERLHVTYLACNTKQIILNFKNKWGFDRRGAIIWRALRETSQNIEISVLQKAFRSKNTVRKLLVTRDILVLCFFRVRSFMLCFVVVAWWY